MSTPEGAGVRHLLALAREPRPAGSDAEGRAREYAAEVLRGAGFDVRVEPFGYSSLPGRVGTPIGGALAGAAVIGASWCALYAAAAWTGPLMLGVGLAVVTLYAWAMLGDAVLDIPLMRARGVNLVATRGAGAPRVWLVAHLDSKSQPIPSAARMAGVVLLTASIVVATLAAVLQLAGVPHRTGWMIATGLAVLGAPLVMASTVGTHSNGAVDNASGVAAVLLAASTIAPRLALGVLLPSAEELGLAGARAWARKWGREHDAGIALNCDGVDDEGAMTIMYSGRRPTSLLDLLRGREISQAGLRVRRMPPGLLTDSVALADRGWRTVTVSRGSMATLRRIHTPADSLDSLRGSGIEPAATLLVRAVEALA